MSGRFESFLALPKQDKRDLFDEVANRLDTLPSYAEKDFWVCLVLDALFNRLPDGHPRLLFKGGTSLSKAFNLIRRFSEDIDLVVYRGDLGFQGQRDPTIASNLSNRKRNDLFNQLKASCTHYVLGEMSAALAKLMNRVEDGCTVLPDESDNDRQTILVEYPTLYPLRDVAYVAPRVRIEAGARSALDPNLTCSVTPYIAHELADWSLGVKHVRSIAPERTLWEKLLILHGVHCGFRDSRRAPADRDRISRHYYDVAMIVSTDLGKAALRDFGLLDSVRNHNMTAFRQVWKRFEEAVPGSVKLVPQSDLRRLIERDYTAMQGMILGDPPRFEWILEQLEHAEAVINGSLCTS